MLYLTADPLNAAATTRSLIRTSATHAPPAQRVRSPPIILGATRDRNAPHARTRFAGWALVGMFRADLWDFGAL